jgi:hypothetical protein
MAHAVNCLPLTALAQVRSPAIPCEIGGGQSYTVTSFFPSTSVSLVSTVPPMLDTHLGGHVASYRKDKLAQPRNSCVRFNHFQSNFSATRILPNSYLFWAGKRLVGYL